MCDCLQRPIIVLQIHICCKAAIKRIRHYYYPNLRKSLDISSRCFNKFPMTSYKLPKFMMKLRRLKEKSEKSFGTLETLLQIFSKPDQQYFSGESFHSLWLQEEQADGNLACMLAICLWEQTLKWKWEFFTKHYNKIEMFLRNENILKLIVWRNIIKHCLSRRLKTFRFCTQLC